MASHDDPNFPEPSQDQPSAFSQGGDALRHVAQRTERAVEDWSHTARAKSSDFLERQVRALERDPSTTILKVLALGFGLGVLIRFLLESAGGTPEPKIDVKRKPTLTDAKFHLGSIFLPFIWPLIQRARKGYEYSAEELHAAADHLRQTDLRGFGKKSAKRVEDWVDDEVRPILKRGRKKFKKYLG